MSRRPPGRSELVALLESNGIRPSRALGQNFVADPNVVDRVARLAGVGPGDHVVEIGAGLGSLTIALAATGASVLALEIDRYLEPLLRQLVEPLGVTVLRRDAMDCEWSDVLSAAPSWVLVGNLPYNIATPLVCELLAGTPPIARMLVMVQREVGERFAAAAGSRVYGAVSARIAYFASARVVGKVGPDVFVPRPNVESVLVEIVRRLPPIDPAEASFGEIDRLLRAGFSGRRKMLRRALVGIVDGDVFAAAGIAPTARAEELDVKDWGRLAAALRRSGEVAV